MPETPARSPQSQARFQELTEFILEYHGAHPVSGNRVIGRTPNGLALALICEDPPSWYQRDVLAQDKLEQLLDEAQAFGLATPAEIWAAGSVAPLDDRLYRLHQLSMWPPPMPELLPVRMHITPGQYERVRHLDDDRRASLITFTHHSQELIDEDDLPQILRDAHAAADCKGTPPELKEHAPTEILLRLLQQAAAHWTPRKPSRESSWNGSRQQALGFLATAAPANRKPEPAD